MRSHLTINDINEERISTPVKVIAGKYCTRLEQAASALIVEFADDTLIVARKDVWNPVISEPGSVMSSFGIPNQITTGG
jgi:hypothetical protein